MLVRVILSASLGGFLFGYDLGLMGGAILAIRRDLGTSTVAEEAVVAAAKAGAVAGAFLGGALMLHYGRRRALAAGSTFFLAGPLLMALAPGLALLIVGRALVGAGIGASAVVVPAYLGELAPAAHRGATVEVYELLLTVGALAAVLVDAALAGLPHDWRWMVGAPLLPALALAVCAAFLPESPRWLVMQGQLDSALAVIHRIYTQQALPPGLQTSTEEVEGELMALWSAVEKERAEVEGRREAHAAVRDTHAAEIEGDSPTTLAMSAKWTRLDVDDGDDVIQEAGPDTAPLPPATTSVPETERQQNGHASLLRPSHTMSHLEGGAGPSGISRSQHQKRKHGFWRTFGTMFHDIYLLARGSERRAFIMALCLAFFNQAVASTAIINYAPTLLEEIGARGTRAATLTSGLVSGAKLLGAIVGMVLVDWVGRRRLLLAGSVLCTLALAGLAAAAALRGTALLVAAMSAFVFSFSVSWAPVFWVLLSELFSMAAKSPAASAATAALFATGAASDALFLTLYDVLGPFSFALYSLIAAVGGLFVALAVPETAGRTLEQVQELLAAPGSWERQVQGLELSASVT